MSSPVRDPEAHSQDSTSIDGKPRPRSVLLVDPTEKIRCLLRTSLEEAGYTVHEVDNGLQGVASYQRAPTDLVIVDLVLPQFKGCDLIMQLTREHIDLKIIVLTEAPDRLAALSEAAIPGSCHVMRKPFSVEQLIRTGEELLAMHCSHRDPQDRRYYPRMPARLLVAFAGESAEGNGQTKDLSIAGCSVESDIVPVPGMHLTLYFEALRQMPSLLVELALVRWSSGRSFGVQFLWMQPKAYAVLRYVLDQLTESREHSQ